MAEVARHMFQESHDAETLRRYLHGWTRLNDVSAPHMLTTVYVKSSGDPVRATDAVMLATRRTILMTISSLCRITRDAATQHCVNQRFPICMPLSGSLFPMGSPSLQRSLAQPRWAQCRSVVLLVDRGQISQIITQDIPRNVEFPTVRALTIKWRRPSAVEPLSNDLLLKVLQNFPSLDSLELSRLDKSGAAGHGGQGGRDC
jgi:hypothetical protein